MYYDQKIKYLELRNDEEKIGGAGFVRMECCEHSWRIVLQLSGLTKERDGKAQAYLGGRGKEVNIGSLEIADGRGRLELRGADAEDMLASGLKYAELEEARIPLSHHAIIYGDLREAGESVMKSSDVGGKTRESAEKIENDHEALDAKEKVRENALKAKSPVQGGMEAGHSVERTEVVKAAEEVKSAEEVKAAEEVKKAIKPKNEETKGAEETKAAEDAKTPKGMNHMREPSMTMEGREGNGASMALKAGKWEQLDAIYPHIAPFGDGRRYLQISPGDFVILKEKSYRKVNNSFLLHGYFSYKHLILHKAMKKGDPVYYVGVPGRFFDKEREVALLFGFESFEGGMEPAKEGDFGYYMMRVEL